MEFAGYGFPFDYRVSRFEEAFTIVRTLLRDGAIDFDGRFYQARDCELVPRSARAGGPPLMIGSQGPRMLAITAPHIDSWNAWYAWFGNEPDGIRPILAKVDDACRAAGRDPDEVERTTAVLVGLTGGGGRATGDADKPRSVPVLGGPEALEEVLRRYASLGITHVQLVLDPITADAIEEIAPVLELMG